MGDDRDPAAGSYDAAGEGAGGAGLPPPPTAAPATPGPPPDALDELVAVARFADGDEARAAARALVEHGIGASVRPAGHPAPGTGDTPGDVEVAVLPAERARAAAVLGRPGDADADADEDAPEAAAPARPAGTGGGPPGRLPVPWRTVIAIWVAGLVIIPLVAGLAVYWVLTR